MGFNFFGVAGVMGIGVPRDKFAKTLTAPGAIVVDLRCRSGYCSHGSTSLLVEKRIWNQVALQVHQISIQAENHDPVHRVKEQ